MTGRGMIIGALVALGLIGIGFVGFDSYVTYRWTRYAPGFSHKNWKQVRPAMAAARVRELIGEPLTKEGQEYGNQFWHYSWQKQVLSRRYFVLLSNGVVVAKSNSLYWD